MDYLALVLGLLLMVIGANYFVDYAVRLAVSLHLHKAVFGAVIVAIGTSLPELVVTIEAALAGKPEIIVGDIMGSNIANVGLVMGIALLVGKVNPAQEKLGGKSKLLFVLSLIFVSLLWLKLLAWPVGAVLLAVAAVLIYNLTKAHDGAISSPGLDVKEKLISWAILAMSLLGVVIGSQVAIDASLSVATAWGVSVGVVASTVIAVGTSLPELAVTLAAIKKKEHGLAVGNIIGSNLFNLALIGGIGACITKLNVNLSEPTLVFFLLFALLAFLLARKNLQLKRWYGAVLVLLFAFYVIVEYIKPATT